jgi:hypothetical protein
VDESQDIHQIEYRWQPKTDMTAIATSMSEESRRSWAPRIGPWVRHPGVDAPIESVRYEVIGHGATGAIAWRQRDPQALTMTEGQPSRPLVSRVLLGSAEVLTPELAMAVCAMGLPEAIGPRPGTVAVGTELPPIDGAALTGLVDTMTDKLDQVAARENGLEALIAAALTDRDTPLSIELPDHFIGLPVRTGPQGRLLWGLRRTLWPLLGPDPGRRGWSFSTFEPPQSDVDLGTLGVVFRPKQAAAQTSPLAFRQELWVRPYDQATGSAESYEQELARLLVAAYLQHSGKELGRLLAEWTWDCTTTDHRIDAAHGALREAAGSPVELPPPAPQPRLRVTLSNAGGGYPEGATTVVPPAFRPAEPSGMPPVPAAPAQGSRDADFPRRPAKLSQLLGDLSNGPASKRFDWALGQLTAQKFETSSVDRAAARKRLRDNRWYIDSLGQDPRVHFDDMLVMIFMHAVLPDLAQPEVVRELTDWASRNAAPPRVIRALYKAGDGTVKRPELGRILDPALAARWLSEDGTSARSAGPSSPRATVPDRHKVRAGAESTPPFGKFPAAAPAPLLSWETVITFLRRRIPVWAALVIAIALMIVFEFVL